MRHLLERAASVILLSLATICAAEAQGVWKQLEDAGKYDGAAHAKAMADYAKKRCDEASVKSDAAKCRSYYLANKYAVYWLSESSPTHDQIITEVLVRKDDAVVCYRDKFISSDDTVPCTPLRRVN